MDISFSEDDEIIYTQKPETLNERTERIQEELKTVFNALYETGKHSSWYTEHLLQDRVVVDVSMILETFKKSCQQSSCNGTSRVTSTTFDGGVLRVSWGCSEGHVGFWTSSKVLCEKNGKTFMSIHCY